MNQQRPVQIEDIDDEFARNVFANMLIDPVLWHAMHATVDPDDLLPSKAMIVGTLRVLQSGAPNGMEMFDAAVRRLVEGGEEP